MAIQSTNAYSAFDTHLHQIVEAAGGTWCGVQESIFPELPMLLFNSPKTGSTLAVRFDPTDFDTTQLMVAVREKLAESDRKFEDRTIPVKASVLQELCATFLKWQTEITDILARSEKCPNPKTKS